MTQKRFMVPCLVSDRRDKAAVKAVEEWRAKVAADIAVNVATSQKAYDSILDVVTKVLRDHGA